MDYKKKYLKYKKKYVETKKIFGAGGSWSSEYGQGQDSPRSPRHPRERNRLLELNALHRADTLYRARHWEEEEAERIAAAAHFAEAERNAAEAERIAALEAEIEALQAEEAEAERRWEAERIAAEEAEAERRSEAERIAAWEAERIAAQARYNEVWKEVNNVQEQLREEEERERVDEYREEERMQEEEEIERLNIVVNTDDDDGKIVKVFPNQHVSDVIAIEFGRPPWHIEEIWMGEVGVGERDSFEDIGAEDGARLGVRFKYTHMRASFEEVVRDIVELNPGVSQEALMNNEEGMVLTLPGYDTIVSSYLNWSRKNIRVLPESIGDLTVYGDLDLSFNNITALPQNFGNLAVLDDLWLGHNRLEELPASFSRIIVWGHLSLTHNQLSRLPDNFGNLKVGRNLDLDTNNLTALPESFPQLDVGFSTFDGPIFGARRGAVFLMNNPWELPFFLDTTETRLRVAMREREAPFVQVVHWEEEMDRLAPEEGGAAVWYQNEEEDDEDDEEEL